MQYNEFIQKVQQQTHLNSPDEAETLTKAVMETLGERLNDKTRESVKAQLPNELQNLLMNRAHDEYQVS